MISFKKINQINPSEYNEVWAIVRSLKVKPAYLKQVIALSPETTLFYDYLNWKKQGIWGKEIFLTKYVPKFIKQLQAQKAIVDPLLKELIEKSRQGKKICLVCFCDEESLCHRSIIMGYLQYLGYDDEIQCDTDYSFYFK